jgi:hypothetical protein
MILHRCSLCSARRGVREDDGDVVTVRGMPIQIGTRVKITGVMQDDPNPRPVGAEGTVDWIGQWLDEMTKQIGVKWDDGSRLILLPDDPFVTVENVIRKGSKQ